MPQLPAPLPPPDSGLLVVLPWAAPVITALIGWFGAQFTGLARLQRTLLDASRQLVEQSQTQHARDNARILEAEAEVIRLRGVVRQYQQRELSLQHWAEREKVTLPPLRPFTEEP